MDVIETPHSRFAAAGARAKARCDAMGGGAFSISADWLERPYLTPAHKAAMDAVAGWMREAGMAVRVDAMANLIGRVEGERPDAPVLLIGSHIDSVRNGGRYDGPLGVTVGIECVAALQGRRLPFAIEVIAFGDEEGSRFPESMACSRALVAPPAQAVLALADKGGTTMADALEAFDLGNTSPATRAPGSVLAYVEAHIEQGPVLQALDLPVGIVTAIAGQLRLDARFTGRAGHAGTTPMALRQDAIAAAAEAVLAVERICGAGPADLVGTVGRVLPGSAAYNVIAGEALIGIDIRAATAGIRDAAAAQVHVALHSIAARRSVSVEIATVQDLQPSPCDARLQELLAAAAEAEGIAPHRLVSGAGHDGMAIAPLCPIAMLFVRCKDGISHHPDEFASAEDSAAAIAVLSGFIDRLAAEPLP